MVIDRLVDTFARTVPRSSHEDTEQTMAAKKTKTTKKSAANKATKSAAGRKNANTRSASTGKQAQRKASAGTSVAQKIEAKIAGLNDWRGERLSEIRALIHEVDPNVIEEWKWMGTPVWSNEGMYANANPFKDKVKVTFHHGAQLEDPKKLFNAGLDGNKWRAIDIYAGDKINKSAFKALLREAIKYNKTHSVPKSKGSRI